MAARILRRWRGLTGGPGVRDEGRRTVVACSGGADSVALAAVFALVNPKPVIAHISHDIRDPGEVEQDRVHVQRLATGLGCSFVHDAVRVVDRAGNLEENARDARYAALVQIAEQTGCRYLATGHHADDQAETVLMNLIRGSGVRGLGGIPAARSLGLVSVIRPALGTRRSELEAFCEQAGIGFRHDSTNDDLGLLRNRVRKELLPMLETIREDAVTRIVDAAENCVDAIDVIENAVDDEWARWARDDGGMERDRAGGRLVKAAVFDGMLRRFLLKYADGEGLDAMTGRAVRAAHKGLISESTEPRVYRIGWVSAQVTAHRIRLEIATDRSSD